MKLIVARNNIHLRMHVSYFLHHAGTTGTK